MICYQKLVLGMATVALCNVACQKEVIQPADQAYSAANLSGRGGGKSPIRGGESKGQIMPQTRNQAGREFFKSLYASKISRFGQKEMGQEVNRRLGINKQGYKLECRYYIDGKSAGNRLGLKGREKAVFDKNGMLKLILVTRFNDGLYESFGAQINDKGISHPFSAEGGLQCVLGKSNSSVSDDTIFDHIERHVLEATNEHLLPEVQADNLGQDPKTGASTGTSETQIF